MKGYKGFNADLKCKDFQYEIGKTYETDEAKLCESGFHFCECPLDVFSYYPPANDGKISRYCEVEADDVSDEIFVDSKRVSKKLTVGAEIGIPGLVKAHVEYVKEKCDKANDTKGYGSANSSVGYGSANVSVAPNCRNESGTASINVGWGKNNMCKGEIGAYIVLGEFGEWDGEKWPLLGAKMGLIDNKNLKSDTWYTLKDGEFVEAKE